MANARIQEQNRKRFDLLRHLYETSQGDRYSIVNLFELAEELGIDREEAHPIADYLAGEGLLKFQTLGGGIAITHAGIVQMERALSEPDEPTDFFPPVNVIYVESMSHSQIQQATTASTQIYSFPEDKLGALDDFIQELRGRIPELELNEDKVAELEAEISTLQAQSKSPSPKQRIIGEAISSIRVILENAAGTAVAALLLQHLAGIL
jgi:hypothetical protein